ncbi:MAG TPA: NUDIX hydrolase [Streptosporangiaceae bacterium]
MTDDEDAARRAWRLRAYTELRRDRPGLFAAAPTDAVAIEDGAVERECVAESVRARMRGAGIPADYGDVGVVYRDDYLWLVRDAVRFPDGRLGSHIRVVPATPRAGSVVLPVADGADGPEVLLVRHFRHAPRAWLWEAPRGFAEPGEEPARTAERELAEELGLAARTLTHLGTVHPDTGISAAAVEVFLAAVDGPPVPDAAEGIDDVRRVSPAELGEWIADGRVSDGFTLSACALARARGLLP